MLFISEWQTIQNQGFPHVDRTSLLLLDLLDFPHTLLAFFSNRKHTKRY